ncbi:insulinase family protein [Nakamurella antarctica]|uniref:Insulinase family protein n=1 Tax=Nakamurella antarctica TaxID=1902245 RepID=A0A3G8ZLE7_9ACTN|nr:pitrilysin family protein [Nakamurella antarctica]AZI58083.1 insulinase family protein [Nakamurella antarctica]
MTSTGYRRARVLERSADGGTVTLSEIPGGLRVITESVPGSRSASVGIWVGVGSIDENPALAGASHYLEHLLFKGTKSRSGADISVAIDAVGGELNAFTSHEYTCYFAHVLADEAQMAVDLVCDVVLDATITPADVDTERQVILEEIAMRDDDPEDVLNDLFASSVFAGSALAEPVIGTIETIESMTRRQINSYYHRRYTPSKMVVSVAGGVVHADVVRWVKRAFKNFLEPESLPAVPRTKNPGRLSGTGSLALIDRDTEQAHLCVGSPALSRHDPRRYALGVFNTALGGGMSSRLFRAIREERGLAYSCYSSSSAYADAGSFSIYAGCQPENLAEVVTVIQAELNRARGGLSVEELARAKGQMVGSMILGLEDNESRMSRIGKNILVRNGYRSVQDEIDAIRAVSQDDILAVLNEVLIAPISAAVVGPYAKTKNLPKVLTSMVKR